MDPRGLIQINEDELNNNNIAIFKSCNYKLLHSNNSNKMYSTTLSSSRRMISRLIFGKVSFWSDSKKCHLVHSYYLVSSGTLILNSVAQVSECDDVNDLCRTGQSLVVSLQQRMVLLVATFC